MVGYLQKKNLIFYTPGKTGSVFALPAKQHTTIQQRLRTQEYLVKETKNPIVYIEERREKARLQEW